VTPWNGLIRRTVTLYFSSLNRHRRLAR
jgi:hypothetical protein